MTVEFSASALYGFSAVGLSERRPSAAELVFIELLNAPRPLPAESSAASVKEGKANRAHIEAGQVRFRYKDCNQDERKTKTLSAEESIRRVLLHNLPEGFQRLRYYRFLGNRHRQEKLAQCRELLGMAPVAEPGRPRIIADRQEELTRAPLARVPCLSPWPHVHG